MPARSRASPAATADEFSSCCFLTLALMEANLDLMEFGLAHDAGQAQQQTVVIGARIVETFAVGDEHANTEQSSSSWCSPDYCVPGVMRRG